MSKHISAFVIGALCLLLYISEHNKGISEHRLTQCLAEKAPVYAACANPPDRGIEIHADETAPHPAAPQISSETKEEYVRRMMTPHDEPMEEAK